MSSSNQQTNQSQKLPKLFLISIIIGISIFFRFFHTAQLFQFSLDEEFWSYLIRKLLVFRQLQLIGGEISSTKIFTGPLYVYFHAPLYVLSRLHPLVGGYFWSGVGVITTLCVYYIAKKKWGILTGQIAGLLYASSCMMALHDRRFWNVTPIPLATLLGWWFLNRTLKGGKRAPIFLSLILTFALHSHFSAIAAIAAVCVVLLLKRFPIKPLLPAIGLFLILNVGPIALFDLRHDFWNLRAAKELLISFTKPKKTESNATVAGVVLNFRESLGSLVYLGSNIDVASEMSHCQAVINARPKSPLWAQAVGLIVFGWLLIWCAVYYKQPLAHFLMVVIVVSLGGLLVYRERVFTYHFSALMPFFFMFAAHYLVTLGRKSGWIVPLVAIALFVAINTQSILNAQSRMSMQNKERIVQTIINNTKGESIDVNFLPSCEIWGYRYLFTVHGKAVAKSWEDGVLAWLYPEEISNTIDTYVTVGIDDPGKSPTFNADLQRAKENAHTIIEESNITYVFSHYPPQTGTSSTDGSL